MMREKLYELADFLGVGIVYSNELPASWWGAFNSMEEVVELNINVKDAHHDYTLLHELCHALQFRTSANIWLEWTKRTDIDGLLELDCEQRVIGWLHRNGYDIEKYMPYIYSNLSNYGLEI